MKANMVKCVREEKYKCQWYISMCMCVSYSYCGEAGLRDYLKELRVNE